MDLRVDPRERVLLGYGEVMSIVQDWELALAVVWWRTKRKYRPQATGDFDSAWSQREIRRLEAAFQRMTVQDIRDAVTAHLEESTAGGLGELIAERNRLAHRFLREQSAHDAKGNFKLGTHDELIALGDRFSDSHASVIRTIMTFDPYKGPVPQHWPAIADRITERTFSGQPNPRDPRLQ